MFSCDSEESFAFGKDRMDVRESSLYVIFAYALKMLAFPPVPSPSHAVPP